MKKLVLSLLCIAANGFAIKNQIVYRQPTDFEDAQLSEAILNYDNDSLDTLLKSGISPDAIIKIGNKKYTLLSAACNQPAGECSPSKTACYLLDHGANPNGEDGAAKPVDEAVRRWNIANTSLLLDAGAKFTPENFRSILQCAVAPHGHGSNSIRDQINTVGKKMLAQVLMLFKYDENLTYERLIPLKAQCGTYVHHFSTETLKKWASDPNVIYEVQSYPLKTILLLAGKKETQLGRLPNLILEELFNYLKKSAW